MTEANDPPPLKLKEQKAGGIIEQGPLLADITPLVTIGPSGTDMGDEGITVYPVPHR